MVRRVLQAATIGCALFLLAPCLSQAEEIRLNSIGIRGGVSGISPIEDKEAQYFHQYDLMANWSLPWGWYTESGWGVGTRLMGSVGALTASGDTAFIGTVVPGVVFEKKDGWLSLEVGGGAALLSQSQFPNQDSGGLFQFVWDTAVRAKVYRGIGLGYWFHHMSDASLYGSNVLGFDLHMIEVSYRF
ncbi:MAG: acyloxyacyl hydrolase [Nitrospirota bacterium]|nr:acyloxyacyl hydrolase [Nitrospirota bacterium]